MSKKNTARHWNVRNKNKTARTAKYQFKCVHYLVAMIKGRPPRAGKAERAALNKLACGQTFESREGRAAHYRLQRKLGDVQATGFCRRLLPKKQAPPLVYGGKPSVAARTLMVDTGRATGLGGLALNGPRAAARGESYKTAQAELLTPGYTFPPCAPLLVH